MVKDQIGLDILTNEAFRTLHQSLASFAAAVKAIEAPINGPELVALWTVVLEEAITMNDGVMNKHDAYHAQCVAARRYFDAKYDRVGDEEGN